MIKLGERVEDTITGFKGVVTGRVEYLSGCIRYEVVSLGDPGKEYWFDAGRLEISSGLGGPRGAPPSIDPLERK